MIVDTHLHIIDQSALSYPWLRQTPALDRDFSYGDYAREASRCGITDALFMEVDVDEACIDDEIAYVRSTANAKGNLIRGAIAACRPESPDFAAFMDRHRLDGFVKGFRRVLHVVDDDVSESTLFRENIRRLSGTGITFDLVVLPRQFGKAIALIDAAPDVQFVLDHCGVPDIVGADFAPWRNGIAEIASRPNVTGKISGVIAYADPAGWTVETLRPWVEHTIGVFGWDRVVWGSDWPVCTLGGSLSTWVAATHALLEGTSPDEKAGLLGANARRLWQL